MTYTELLSGLVYKNECILSQDPHFQYKSVSFYDQNFNFLKSKTGGVAIITDRRFLMLSCQYDQSKYTTENNCFLMLQEELIISRQFDKKLTLLL